MSLPDPTFANQALPTEVPADVCADCGSAVATAGGGGQCVRCLLTLALEEEAANEHARDVPPCFGDFEVSRREDGRLWELGRGAMGVTYRAQDTLLDRPVALKVVGGHLAERVDHRTRFLHEARRAAALRHPNVASVFQYGVRDLDGQPFYAMELVEGETLEERVRRTGPLPAALTLQIGSQIAQALQAAEERGIIHRDLKPSNVMLVHGQEGSTLPFVKVIDFGLARAASAAAGLDDGPTRGSHQTGFAGTPAYASPEQLAGGVALDARTDFYALGATLWFLLTGRTLYGGLAPGEIRRRQTEATPPFDGLPTPPAEKKALVKLLRRLLAADRTHRPQAASELIEAIQQCQHALASATAVHRGRQRWLAAGVALLLAGAAAWGLGSPGRQRELRASAIEPPRTLAVLPFDNLSRDGAHAFLAAGVREEVANSLARHPGLKVLSPPGLDRRPAGGSAEAATRDFGAKLGATDVLAGSVQRDGEAGPLRVQVVLRDARTGVQSWSSTYEQPASGLFALQHEIADAVAQRLGLAVRPAASSPEPGAHVPDPVAYEMYLRAESEANLSRTENLEQMHRILHWLQEAVARDPRFARAHAEITYREAVIYSGGYDRSPAQAERVRAAAEMTSSLGADRAEAHLAQGAYAYHVPRDFERARQEFTAAVGTLPNDARAWFLLGLAERRQGHWEAALTHLRRAGELDPLNVNVPRKVAATLAGLGRGGEIVAQAEAWERRDPQESLLQSVFLDCRSAGAADTRLLHAAADLLPAGVDGSTSGANLRYEAALLDRDPAAALRALAEVTGPMDFESPGGQRWPKELLAALPLRMLGDAEAARRGLLELRPTLAEAAQSDPDPAPTEMLLARLDALLGRHEDAVREGRAALARRPPEQDAYDGPMLAGQYAAVLALAGERAAALDLLGELGRRPGGPCLRDLSLHPDWDDLRGDPRFAALLRAAGAPR